MNSTNPTGMQFYREHSERLAGLDDDDAADFTKRLINVELEIAMATNRWKLPYDVELWSAMTRIPVALFSDIVKELVVQDRHPRFMIRGGYLVLRGVTAKENSENATYLTFPVRPSGTWVLSITALARLKEAYRGVDVEKECRKAFLWITKRPSNRMSPGGMMRFLEDWMERALDFKRRGATAKKPTERHSSFKATDETEDLLDGIDR